MKDERLRQEMKEALDVEAPDPSLRPRVMASMPADGKPGRSRVRQAALGGVAVGLMVAIAGSFMYFGRLGSRRVPSLGPARQVLVTSPLDFKCTLPVNGGCSYGLIPPPAGQFVLYPPVMPAAIKA